MPDLSLALQAELLLRLTLASLLGGVLGWEREVRRRPAGLRTHILVSLGSAAFTIAGAYGLAGIGLARDPTRVAAQVVSGIGFLGAGTILRTGGTVRGLTTAASIWVAAAIGLLSGVGLYLLAVACAIIGIVVLRVLKELAPGEPRAPDADDQ